MKRLCITLALLTIATSAPMSANQTYSLPLSKNTLWTACYTIAGALTASWVFQHYWNKYEVSCTEDTLKKSFNSASPQDRPALGMTGGIPLGIEKLKIENDVREHYQYSCLALGIAGAAIAAKGLHALLTAK